MKTITVKASRAYDVSVGAGLLCSAGERISALLPPPATVLLISDTNVYPLYGEAVTASLKAVGYTVYDHVIPAGESSKSQEQLVTLWSAMAEIGLTRSDLVVALGGGVVGDLAGFAAATYLRGIAYCQIPTTLLAMVDSSVGGKTAVNLPAGKNLCGAFWQPIGVLCDTDVLKTLPARELANGMAEVIKYGYIGNPALLDLLAGDITDSMEDIIARCVCDKRDIVEADERESGPRRLLNLGHTAGHAIERLSGFHILHGEGVAIGMLLAAKGAVALGICSADVPAEMEGLLTRYGLETESPYMAKHIATVALCDKKRAGDSITLILPTARGRAIPYTVSVDSLADFFKKGGTPA